MAALHEILDADKPYWRTLELKLYRNIPSDNEVVQNLRTGCKGHAIDVLNVLDRCIRISLCIGNNEEESMMIKTNDDFVSAAEWQKNPAFR